LYSWSTSDGDNSNFPNNFTIIKKNNYLYLFYTRIAWQGADCYVQLTLNDDCDTVTKDLLKKNLKYYNATGTGIASIGNLLSVNVFIANNKIYYSDNSYFFELDETNYKWKQISNSRNLSDDKTWVHKLPFFNLNMPYIVKTNNTYYKYNVSAGSCSSTGTINQTTLLPSSSTQLYLPNVNILIEIGLLYFSNYSTGDGIYFKTIYEPTYANGYYEPLTLKTIPDFH
jgi:hypothetical protein